MIKYYKRVVKCTIITDREAPPELIFKLHGVWYYVNQCRSVVFLYVTEPEMVDCSTFDAPLASVTYFNSHCRTLVYRSFLISMIKHLHRKPLHHVSLLFNIQMQPIKRVALP
jgi:hypothetical protein